MNSIIILVIFTLTFIFELIGKHQDSNIKPSTLIDFIANCLKCFFTTLGEYFAVISSFVDVIGTYIYNQLKELWMFIWIQLENIINFIHTYFGYFLDFIKEYFQILIDFIKQIDYKYILETFMDIATPILRIFISPYHFIVGYMDEMSDYRYPILIMIGSVFVIITIILIMNYCFKYFGIHNEVLNKIQSFINQNDSSFKVFIVFYIMFGGLLALIVGSCVMDPKAGDCELIEFLKQYF